jgi:hypothetical protein
MRQLLLSASLLASLSLAIPAMAAGSSTTTTGTTTTGTTASPGAAAAANGGVTGDCPAGQVKSANGQCAPGQPNATGTTSGGAAGATDMPASPHQQEVLKPAPKSGG